MISLLGEKSRLDPVIDVDRAVPRNRLLGEDLWAEPNSWIVIHVRWENLEAEPHFEPFPLELSIPPSCWRQLWMHS